MIIFLFGIGIILSQFYIFNSGIPQPAHYLILISGLMLCLIKNFFIYCKNDFLKYLSLFVIYQFFINSFFSIIYQSLDFLIQSLYIFYGYFIFLIISNFAKNMEKSIFKISIYAWLSLFILFLIAIFGFGENKFDSRYNGYFNDPNQMAFWILCVSSVIMVLNKSKFFQITTFLMSTILITLTASRSGLLGYLMLLLGFLFSFCNKNLIKISSIKFLLIFFIIFAIIFITFINASSDITPINLFINRLNEVDLIDQAGVRGYLRVFFFPEYLIFGAGHGLDSRFYSENEIHSTFAALLFYYGTLGLFLFVTFCFLIFKNLSFSHKFYFLAPFLYSLSTFGMRTPIFWIFLGVFYVFSKNKIFVKINL